MTAGEARLLHSGEVAEKPETWRGLEPGELGEVLGRVERLTLGLGETAGDIVRATAIAAAAAARLALDRRLTAAVADQLIASAAADAGVDAEEARVHVYLRTLLEVVVVAPSPARALDGLLATLVGLTPAFAARVEADDELVRPAVGGELGDAPLAVPVPGGNALLLVRPSCGLERRSRAFAEEAARVVGGVVTLRGRRSPAEVAKLEAAQRRLRRLALDLHDGPAQDVAALSADAALLEAELGGDLSPERVEAISRLAGEIRERLGALNREIRDLSEVLEPRSMLREPLGAVLAREAASFARRTGIMASLEVEDDLGVMTASQQIALARVAREALANVAKHADASNVHVSARVTRRGVSLMVADDGRGFDVARRRRSAAAGGRLGLAGMFERIRLLGGTLAIDSRPGGPTRVEAIVPRWRPDA